MSRLLPMLFLLILPFAAFGQGQGGDPRPAPERGDPSMRHDDCHEVDCPDRFDGARVALVIGNESYGGAARWSSRADSQYMADTLDRLGFFVDLESNLDRASMVETIDRFGDQLREAGPRAVGLFYYTGYAVNLRGRNLLLPIDTDATSEPELEAQGIDMQLVFDRMGDTADRARIVVIDGSRSNPFENRIYGHSRGLRGVEPPRGTIVAFSSAPHTLVVDGDAPLGTYTRVLTRVLEGTDGDIRDVFARVRYEVEAETGGHQRPWHSSALRPPLIALSEPPTVRPPPHLSMDVGGGLMVGDMGPLAGMRDEMPEMAPGDRGEAAENGDDNDDDKGYFEADVWFATDRKLEEGDDDDRARFGGERGDGELALGRVKVSIPDTHEVGHIESPSWYHVLSRNDPSKWVLVLSVELAESREAFRDEVRAERERAGAKEGFVFIHGFNVSFDDAAKRAAQLAYDLKFPGLAFLYSWPSKGDTLDYNADEASVKWTRPHLSEFLRLVMSDLELERVHLVAHSMGNRALTAALKDFDPATLPEGSASLRQIVLAAPDIDAGVFEQLAEEFRGKAERYTLYTSKNDKAIQLSAGIHQAPRAGGEIVIVEGVDTVDASNVHTEFLGHSYVGDSILPDLHMLIRLGKPPEERHGLDRKEHEGGVYWMFRPGAM